MSRRTTLLVIALALVTARAAADDASFAKAFREAELAERALGELNQAAAKYHDAALAAGSDAQRARAELREGSCLRRLGRTDEARALLEPLASGESIADDVRRAARSELDSASIAAPAPAAPESGPAADRRLLAEREHEFEVQRAETEAALQRAEGRAEELARELRQKDKELETMRAQVAPSSPEEAMRAGREGRERKLQADRELARTWASFARRLHREGRFIDARDFAYAALDKDPQNAEARALLTLVAAPLGVRERLYDSLLGVLALADEVRGARAAAEIDTLVAEARRRQERREYGASVAPLEQALALVESESATLRDAAASRDVVLSMLRQAQTHGAERSPVAAARRADDAETRGLAAVRELLVDAGSEVAPGLALRFHDVGAVLEAAGVGLPPAPVGTPPQGWTVSAEGADPARLLVEFLRASEAAAFAAPGARIEPAAGTIVALCDAEAQTRLAERVVGIGDVTAPAADLNVAAWRVAPGAIDTIVGTRGISPSPSRGGARFASLPASDAAAFLAALGKDARVWPSAATLRAATLRSFRMVAGTTSASLTLDLLPVTRPVAGVGVRAVAESTPGARPDGPRLRQDASAGAVLEPGGALVLFGIADPADPARELAVVVTYGTAPAVVAPPRGPPPPSSQPGDLPLPAALRGIVDVGPEPLVVAGRPVPSRREAIAARIRKAARSAVPVDVGDTRVRVTGPDEARAAARRVLDQADVVRGMQAFEVVAYAVTPNVEEHLLTDLPRIERLQGDEFASTLVRAEERKFVERALIGTKGRLPFFDSRVAAPPTGRADLARVVRSSYRREVEVATGGEPSWGRGETQVADEGLLVAVRPFGRRETGRVDVDLSMRAAWIADRGESRRDTALGSVTTYQPKIDSWCGDLATTIADDELLVVAGVANPFPDAGDRTRLVLTVAVAPSR